ncbi:hypothetical protein AYI72_01720 [Shewanella algae]|nr:hypothetical protein BS332_15430 [Shewanella algae]TVL10064.1 hypothetical protein AYI72_01720 [Shewanella algae]UYA15387.1 hypothetical protein D3X10_05540 [Shewanella algae]
MRQVRLQCSRLTKVRPMSMAFIMIPLPGSLFRILSGILTWDLALDILYTYQCLVSEGLRRSILAAIKQQKISF